MKTSFTSNTISKRISSLFIAGLCMVNAQAGIIVSPSASVMEIPADKAANAFSPAYTQLNDFSIVEKKSSDFASSFGKSATLVLTAPGGWTFRPCTGTISFTGKDISEVSMKTSWTTIIISFKVNGMANMDAMTISGIEVQAADGKAIDLEGSIYRSSANPGTAIINGIISTGMANGAVGTAFAIMMQTSGMATKLVFAKKPSTSVAGAALEQQPVIITQDQFGNPTSKGLNENQSVKIRLSSGTGSLNGTSTVMIENGMAIFSDLQLSMVGTKKLMATSGSLSFAVSNEFNVTESDSSPRISSEDNDDYDPDWICFLQNSLPSNINMAA